MTKETPTTKPPYLKPLSPRYNRRARHHDYSRPGKYMITLKKAHYIQNLCLVAGNLSDTESDPPRSISTPVGALFEQAMKTWLAKYPVMEVHELVIMPDHIHFCLAVTRNLPTGLSRAIAVLMGQTTSLYHKSDLSPAEHRNEQVPFFQKGFTDSIAYTSAQFETQKAYIHDNPRRLLMKRLHPDLFYKRWVISVNGINLMAMGNIFLLKNPQICVVRFSRKFDEATNQANLMSWYRCIENGGALISPFIHPFENSMRKAALTGGGNIIRIIDNGFSERYSPNREELEAFTAKRLLLIGPMEYSSQKVNLRYTFAQYLNSIAELLASHPTGMTIRPLK